MTLTPTIQVLVGFETTTGFGNPFQLDNATYGLLDTGTLGGLQYVDLTSMVQAISITRGRNRELEQFNAGTASVRFRDPTRILDPLNASSPYYPFLGPRNPLSIYADGTEIFCGLVGDWNLDYGISAQDNIVTATCSDVFTVLANQSMNEWTPTAQLTGARVAAVLARPEIIYQGAVSVDAGSSTLGAYLVAAGQNVLQYLQLVTASEQGYLFVAGDGTLVFRDRAASLNPTASIEFKDDGTGVKYQTLTNSYGDELLYNYIQTQSPAGAVQTTSDATSVALYQAQQYSKLDLLNSTTTEVAALGNYLLGRYKTPQLRFSGVQIELAALDSTDQAAVLATDLTDIASVTKSFGSGSPASVTQTLITTGVSHQIRPGSHVVRFTFESTDGNAYMTLDNAIFGTLDTNLLAF
jgi:hypothetical protein